MCCFLFCRHLETVPAIASVVSVHLFWKDAASLALVSRVTVASSDEITSANIGAVSVGRQFGITDVTLQVTTTTFTTVVVC